MCIIIYKPKGVQPPKLDTIKRCWNANPNGAGFLYRQEGGTWAYAKGLMTLERLVYKMGRANLLRTDTEFAIHFRITTHGGTCERLTHPFVIDKNPFGVYDGDIYTQTKGKYIMHNGIFTIPNSEIPEGHSDTSCFAVKASESYDAFTWARYNESIVGNCRVIMFEDHKEPTFLGNWIDEEGIKYSNDAYKPYVRYTPSVNTKGRELYGYFGGHGDVPQDTKPNTFSKPYNYPYGIRPSNSCDYCKVGIKPDVKACVSCPCLTCNERYCFRCEHTLTLHVPETANNKGLIEDFKSKYLELWEPEYSDESVLQLLDIPKEEEDEPLPDVVEEEFIKSTKRKRKRAKSKCGKRKTKSKNPCKSCENQSTPEVKEGGEHD